MIARTIKKSLVSLMALSFFFILAIKADAYTYPYFGVQPTDDEYLYFGNEDFPATSKQGITFSVYESSISFQSVIAQVTTEYVAGSTFVEDRQVTEFFVLANGRIVDFFEPAWDAEAQKWRTSYRLRLAFQDWNIGSIVNLQIVAISTNNALQQHVVGWSDVQGPYQLKSLPVIDREAVTLLESILAKLSNMSAMLEMKLTQLTKAVEDIYTPKPATEARLENAMNELQEKLPMNEMIEQVDEANRVLEESKRKLQSPGERIKIGGDFCFIPGVAESCFPVMDLTDWKEQLLLFRKIAEAALWVYFFYMLMEKLTPKPRL